MNAQTTVINAQVGTLVKPVRPATTKTAKTDVPSAQTVALLVLISKPALLAQALTN
jgi:hypothetical protein